MLIKLNYLKQKYDLTKITGILHIGAHECEELNDYKNIGVKDEDIIWIEGNEEIANKMKKTVKNVYNLLVSDEEKDVEFIITNNGQSSSILELEEHKKEHPNVYEIKRIIQKTQRIDTFFNNNNIEYKYNFVNLDIQGAELKALKSMEIYLDKVEYIYIEVNLKHLYKDCPLIYDIDNFLEKYNFVRCETLLTRHGWGDAFYIKSQLK
jgi:FkbM family methyltransferase